VEASATAAPRSGSSAPLVVLISLLDLQQGWVDDNLIRPVARAAGVPTQVVFYDDPSDLHSMLKLDRDANINRIGLILVDEAELHELDGRIKPLTELAPPDQVEAELRQHLPIARDGARVGKDVAGMPRSVEAPVMVYRRSKVQDAVQGWESMHDELDALFKQYNGRGLPAGYRLPEDPGQWNSYDLAVVGYYWAHTPYAGVQAPRIAHRGYDGAASARDLYQQIYSQGGSADDVLAGDTQPVRDAFTWEAFFARAGLYPEAMWRDGWGLGALWNAVRDGTVFLTFMTPTEVAMLHGGAVKGSPALTDDPADLAVARIPRGVSLELGADGQPARVGDGAAPALVTYWAIPKSTPDEAGSYRLVQGLTSADAQAKEAAAFATIPSRQDVDDALADVPAEPWVRDLLAVGSQQARAVRPLPLASNAPLVADQYAHAWHALVEGRTPLGATGPVDSAALRAWLASHAQTLQALLK